MSTATSIHELRRSHDSGGYAFAQDHEAYSRNVISVQDTGSNLRYDSALIGPGIAGTVNNEVLTAGAAPMIDKINMMQQVSSKPGFFAALDQSGGSTPGAMKQYGIPDTAYHGDAEMFKLMHEMRVRVMTAPSFTGDKLIGAILFEKTMDGLAESRPVPTYLWEVRHVVPFLKIDKGLADEKDGMRLMKPMPDLDALLDRAVKLGIFGTKMRSVIHLASKTGIASIVEQQFAFGQQILRHGLIPILEPEVLIVSPDKPAAEAMLLDQLRAGLDALPEGKRVMLKLTLPEKPDLYQPLIAHKNVARVVALSGGYPLEVACERLAANHNMIASFSRALLDDLRQSMSEEEFDKTLSDVINKIYQASTVKR